MPQTSNGSELLQNLISNKADVVLLDKGSVFDFNKVNQNSVRMVSGIPLIATFPETLAVRKDEEKLMITINTALKNIKQNGFIDKVIKKYKLYGYHAENN